MKKKKFANQKECSSCSSNGTHTSDNLHRLLIGSRARKKAKALPTSARFEARLFELEVEEGLKI